MIMGRVDFLLDQPVDNRLLRVQAVFGLGEDGVGVGLEGFLVDLLPAYRGKEIDEPTLEAHAETIFTQAENRLHTQKAILDWLVS